MEYSVYFTELADADIDEIIDYIALDSPEKALLFVDKLQSRIQTVLERFPLSGKRYKNTWYFSFDNYIAVYDVDETNKAVYVHLVSEGHRQWRTVLDSRL